MSKALMEYFNKQPRLGVLSTSNKAGEVNSAYFGSPRMIDESTIMVALGKNKKIPGTVYLIINVSGKAKFLWA
jgi:hypothetical protein